MNCQTLEFCPVKSKERIERAAQVLGRALLNRVLAFVLYLLGAKRPAVAELVGMRDESLKAAIALIMRDGFPAFRDRRRSDVPRAPAASTAVNVRASVRCEGEWCIVELGANLKPMRLSGPRTVQARTVLLSMLNAGWLSTQETAVALGICSAHCRELAAKLERDGVEDALIDKRQGQALDYRVGPQEKAEIIRQFTARVVTGHSTSSEALANAVNEHCKVELSARTVRWHVSKFGLTSIKKTLPVLLSDLKKTS